MKGAGERSWARRRADAAGARRRRRWDAENPGTDAIGDERRRTLGALLQRCGVDGLTRSRVLELCCGRGDGMRMLAALGARADALVGIDLSRESLAEARPRVDGPLVNADARSLALRTASVDVVAVITAFSSVRGRRDRMAVAREIDRVLRPQGHVLWYDMRVPSHVNRDVSPVRRGEIRSLFPGYSIASRSITVVPPLARRLGRFAPTTYPILARVRLLRTHLVAVLAKRGFDDRP
jgi:ubiquinone/menaquinone biosynthesis C-methylase UbiE